MGNAALRGCEQGGGQGAMHRPMRTCTDTNAHTHARTCTLRHTQAHVHRSHTQMHSGPRPACSEAEGALWKPAPGDHHVDGVFHRQLQLEFRFVGPRHVVVTEGRQRALSSSLSLFLHLKPTTSFCSFCTLNTTVPTPCLPLAQAHPYSLDVCDAFFSLGLEFKTAPAPNPSPPGG